jgi:TolB protein
MSNRNGLSHKFFSLMLAASFLVIGASYCLAEDQPTTAPTYRDYQPVWSPDGKKIAFVSTRDATKDSSNIWVVNADGSNLRQFTYRGKNDYPTWSPDGTKLAFQSNGLIWEIELATSTFTPLTSSGRNWYAPDWHPRDALKILCALRTIFVPQDNDLVVIDPNTCRTRESGTSDLRERLGSDDRPRWSRDGSRVAFIGEVYNRESKSSKWYLMTVLADGSDLRTYSEVGRTCYKPSWLPDGSGVIIEDGKVYKFSEQKKSDLFPEPAKDPDVSANGKMVAYSEEIEGKGSFIFVRNMDGTGKKQITFPKPAEEKPADAGTTPAATEEKPAEVKPGDAATTGEQPTDTNKN